MQDVDVIASIIGVLPLTEFNAVAPISKAWREAVRCRVRESTHAQVDHFHPLGKFPPVAVNSARTTFSRAIRA